MYVGYLREINWKIWEEVRPDEGLTREKSQYLHLFTTFDLPDQLC